MAFESTPFWVVDQAKVPLDSSSPCEVLIRLHADDEVDPNDPFAQSVVALRRDPLMKESIGRMAGLIINKEQSGVMQSLFTGIMMYIFVPTQDESADPIWGPGHCASETGLWASWGDDLLRNEIADGGWGCLELSTEEFDQLLRLPRHEMYPTLVQKGQKSLTTSAQITNSIGEIRAPDENDESLAAEFTMQVGTVVEVCRHTGQWEPGKITEVSQGMFTVEFYVDGVLARKSVNVGSKCVRAQQERMLA